MMNSIRRLFTYALLLAFCLGSGLFGQRMPQDYWYFDGITINGKFGPIGIGTNDRIYLSKLNPTNPNLSFPIL